MNCNFRSQAQIISRVKLGNLRGTEGENRELFKQLVILEIVRYANNRHLGVILMMTL